jgi:hypothetical protein
LLVLTIFEGPGFAGAFLLWYASIMTKTTDKPTRLMPSATPTEAEIAAWAALPRDEQVRRYQELFQHPDCNMFTTDTPDEILAAARQRVAARRHG